MLLLDSGPDFDLEAARAALARRISAVPRMRQRLQRAPFGCGRPIWVDDDRFDPDNHIRVEMCPAPGDLAAVLGVAATPHRTAPRPHATSLVGHLRHRPGLWSDGAHRPVPPRDGGRHRWTRRVGQSRRRCRGGRDATRRLAHPARTGRRSAPGRRLARTRSRPRRLARTAAAPPCNRRGARAGVAHLGSTHLAEPAHRASPTVRDRPGRTRACSRGRPVTRRDRERRRPCGRCPSVAGPARAAAGSRLTSSSCPCPSHGGPR